jgi:S1-C subfamily serine protease
LWAGAILQEPFREIAAQRGLPREGVYVARYWFGSPANRYGLRATRRVLAVDGTRTPDLDAFAAAIAGVPDRGSVRLRTVDLDGRVDVMTLKTDLEYWPTSELRRGQAGWTRTRLPSTIAHSAGAEER